MLHKYITMLKCKAEFSASLLQSSVSHDPSEIIYWFGAQETFLIISFLVIMLQTVAKYF